MMIDSAQLGGGASEGYRAIEDAKGFLIDWDGCCAYGNRPLPEAVDFLKIHGSRTAIVSNNSSNTSEEFISSLRRLGVTMQPEQIVLAGVEALRRAAEFKSHKALVLGDMRMRATAGKMGVKLVRDDANMVILLRDTRFTYPRLDRAVQALRNGAKLIVANPDLTHPGANGRVVPETGALLAAIGACVGLEEIEMEVIGKPGPALFHKACEAIGVDRKHAVMIGDNPLTDIKGAEAVGMNAVLVENDPRRFFEKLLRVVKTA